MRRLFKPGGEIEVGYEPAGLQCRPCVMVRISALRITLRLTMQDAETLGESLIQQVRRGEEEETPCPPA